MDLKKKLEELQARFREGEDLYRNIRAKAKAEKREMTQEEFVIADKNLDQMQALKGAIDEVRAMIKEADNPADIPAGDRVYVDGQDGIPVASRNQGIPGHASWKEIFGRAPRSSGTPFNSMRELQRAAEMRDPRLVPIQAAMSEGVPADGGFAIGENQEAIILDASLPAEIIRPRARVFGITAGDVLKVPSWDDGDRSSTVYGSISRVWVPESGTITATNPKLKRYTLTCHKSVIDTKSSSELREDLGAAYNGDPLAAALSRAFGYFADEDFLNGDGAGKPLGILHAPCLVEIDPEGGQTPDTINWANITKMISRALDYQNSVWLANPTTLPELLSLVIPAGASAVPVAVLQPDGTYRVAGRPVLLSEHLPLLGDEGDIVLANLSFYGILIRTGMTFLISNGAYWSTDEVGVRMRARMDGQPLLSEPIQPRHGDTQSAFVVLKAR